MTASSERRRRLIRAAQGAGIAVALVVLLATLSPPATSTAYRAEGRPVDLPEQQLASVDAVSFGGILVGLRGTPVGVNLWASWCAPCRAEMPLLERGAGTYEGQVVFLGVASKDSRAAAAPLATSGAPGPCSGDGPARRAPRRARPARSVTGGSPAGADRPQALPYIPPMCAGRTRVMTV